MEPLFFQGIDAMVAAAKVATTKKGMLKPTTKVATTKKGMLKPTTKVAKGMLKPTTKPKISSIEKKNINVKKNNISTPLQDLQLPQDVHSSQPSQDIHPPQPPKEDIPRPPPQDIFQQPDLIASEAKIKKALNMLVEAGSDRYAALDMNRDANIKYCEKDAVFNNLVSSMGGPSAVIGNNIFRASKRNEVDTAVIELNIKQKCGIVYDEEQSLEFYKENKEVLMQMAVQYFSRRNTAKCSGLDINIKRSGDGGKTSRIMVKNKKKPVLEGGSITIGNRGLLEDNSGSSSKPSTSFFDIKGIPHRTIERNFVPVTTNTALKPCERTNLDVTKAEASHVFSTMRRVVSKRPLYFAGNTFWQLKPTENNKVRWTEVVGWDEKPRKDIQNIVQVLKPSEDNLFILPSSFNKIVIKLMARYKPLLVRGARTKERASRGRTFFRSADRVINPRFNSPVQYNTIIKKLDDCLGVLLAIGGKYNVFTNSTVEVYRRKFRRYVIFCFAFYTLNKDKHSQSISSLPFNFFNLFAFMYSHGRDMSAASFIGTLTFLHNHIFRPMGSATPATSARRLMDIDYAVMKGGQAVVREFGSPVKTSLHTRTLVSFLGYAEMAMGVTASMLIRNEKKSHLSETLRNKVALSLDRWCDSIIFIFFTFVLFHRFSGVKRVTLEGALALIMGQTHVHTNKVRAVKLLRLARNNQSVPTDNVRSFENQVNIDNCDDDDDDDVSDASAMTMAYPHLLGLPYAVQAALGLPVSRINPLMATDSGGVTGDVNKYRLGSLLDVTSPELRRPLPDIDEAAGNIGFFENLVSSIIDDYYGEDTFSRIIDRAKRDIGTECPYDHNTCMLSPYHLGECGDDNNDEVSSQKFKLVRDVNNYLMSSPMRTVFIIARDSDNQERFLSIGDLAFLAVWVKKSVLGIAWDTTTIAASITSGSLPSYVVTFFFLT
uniref:Wsv433-like protein n=1 Tax=Chionoecetes opilio bacilliform virus TaxID=1825681 RepID=A0A1Q3DLZ4_9VIRU|nr:hypothetical protein SCV_088 [Chionoecetes opilio bacilliform virus]